MLKLHILTQLNELMCHTCSGTAIWVWHFGVGLAKVQDATQFVKPASCKGPVNYPRNYSLIWQKPGKQGDAGHFPEGRSGTEGKEKGKKKTGDSYTGEEHEGH